MASFFSLPTQLFKKGNPSAGKDAGKSTVFYISAGSQSYHKHFRKKSERKDKKTEKEIFKVIMLTIFQNH